MRRIILYAIAVIAILFPLLTVAVYGADWGEFIADVLTGALIAFLFCTVANLMGRVEKLESKNTDE